MPRGWKCLGSPDYSIDRAFTSTFYFPHKVTKANQITHIYRNPIYLAREYKKMIASGLMKNQSDFVQKLGISRVRIHQILSLLKLSPLIIQELEKLGDPLKKELYPNACYDHILINLLKNKKNFSIF